MCVKLSALRARLTFPLPIYIIQNMKLRKLDKSDYVYIGGAAVLLIALFSVGYVALGLSGTLAAVVIIAVEL